MIENFRWRTPAPFTMINLSSNNTRLICQTRVKSFCSNFVVISNLKWRQNYYKMIYSNFVVIWNDDKITTNWLYLYFLDWTFSPILAQYVLHTFVNSMDCQTNTDHDWNYNEWSKQSIWTEYKAHSYLTYILFGVRQNANLFEVFGSNEYFAEQWVWFMK